MDSIELNGLQATSRGVQGQGSYTYIVDVVLFLDLQNAANTDDLTQTVDYAQIARRIVSLIESSDDALVESVASRVADAVLLSYQVQRVKVSIRRKNPFPNSDVTLSSVGVCLERTASIQSKPTRASVVSAEIGADYSQIAVTQGDRNDGDRFAQSQDTGETQIFHKAVIALSGNIGDVKDAMRTAIVSLDGVPGSQIIGISPLYSCKNVVDYDGLSAVVVIETTLTPSDLYSVLAMIELAHGRSQNLNVSACPLKLILVDVDGKIWSNEQLIAQIQSPQWLSNVENNVELPYKHAWKSADILKPWSDIEPNASLKGTNGGSVTELARSAPDEQCVQLLSDSWILGGSV